MQAASIDIKDLLIDESSLGLAFATNLFIGKEPSSPNNCVTIFDTASFPPMLTLDRNGNYEYPSVQIRIRNTSYQTAWDLANTIKDLLHGSGQVTMENGTLYTSIICMSTPTLLDWDENNRARFIINFNIQRR
jgi:hypothetical protein